MFPYQPVNHDAVDAAERGSAADAPTRGLLLSAWLILNLLAAVFAALGNLVLLERLTRPHAQAQPILLILAAALYLAIAGYIACLIAVYRWKEWGLYGIVVYLIVSPIIEWLLGRADVSDFIAPFVQIAILWRVVGAQRDDFT